MFNEDKFREIQMEIIELAELDEKKLHNETNQNHQKIKLYGLKSDEFA